MSPDIEQLVWQLAERLKKANGLLTTAESCTGGGLSYFLTQLPGSSVWFDRGFVTYSNDAKIQLLGVHVKTLTTYGSVSKQTALEMAEGALKNSKATVAISITGIAGPDGGSKEKPVGTVWMGFAAKSIPSQSLSFLFTGNRNLIREKTIREAFTQLLLFIG